MIDPEIAQDLLGHGIRPSMQRIQIYRYLDEHRTHPTVDEIYSRIHKLIPVLSRMTVYNTVKLFAQKGVVSPLIIEDKELRYDMNTKFHGHFRCEQCGTVYDIMDIGDVKLPANLVGFRVSHRHMYFMGLCKHCA